MTESEITLKEYIEKLLCQYKEAHEKEHKLLAENLELARVHMEHRLVGMNEFRAQILSERSHMVSVDKFEGKMNEFEARYAVSHKQLEDRVGNLEKSPGRTATAAWKWVLGIVGAILIGVCVSLTVYTITRLSTVQTVIEQEATKK
jgi:hypothetical protein